MQSNLISRIFSTGTYFQYATDDTSINREGTVLYIEVLRAYAIFMVIIGHSASQFMLQFNEISLSNWMAANVYFSFAHHCVPLFVMASGVLLLDHFRNQTYVVFFKKRFLKVVIPCIFWGVVYILWRIGFKGEEIKLFTALRFLYTGSAYTHLWFLNLIIGLYLATPILATFLEKADQKCIIYFLALWFLFSLQVFPKGLFNARIGIHVYITRAFIGYFLIGKVLHPYLLTKRARKFFYLIVLVSTFITGLGIYIMTLKNSGIYNGKIFTELSGPIVIIMSVSVFMLIKSIDYNAVYSKFPMVRLAVLFFSRLSFGIYFIHMIISELIVHYASSFGIEILEFSPFWVIPLVAVCILLLSGVLVQLIRQVPLLKVFVP